MTEIRYKNAIVRIHGVQERKTTEEATMNFMKKVIRRKKEKK